MADQALLHHRHRRRMRLAVPDHPNQRLASKVNVIDWLDQLCRIASACLGIGISVLAAAVLLMVCGAGDSLHDLRKWLAKIIDPG